MALGWCLPVCPVCYVATRMHQWNILLEGAFLYIIFTHFTYYAFSQNFETIDALFRQRPPASYVPGYLTVTRRHNIVGTIVSNHGRILHAKIQRSSFQSLLEGPAIMLYHYNIFRLSHLHAVTREGERCYGKYFKFVTQQFTFLFRSSDNEYV